MIIIIPCSYQLSLSLYENANQAPVQTCKAVRSNWFGYAEISLLEKLGKAKAVITYCRSDAVLI